MTVPKKPATTKDDFIKAAATEKTSNLSGTKQLNVLMPANLHATIKANSSGNMMVFTQRVFLDYFKRNNIDIQEIS